MVAFKIHSILFSTAIVKVNLDIVLIHHWRMNKHTDSWPAP